MNTVNVSEKASWMSFRRQERCFPSSKTSFKIRGVIVKSSLGQNHQTINEFGIGALKGHTIVWKIAVIAGSLFHVP